MKALGWGVGAVAVLFLSLDSGWGGWLMPCPGRYSPGNDLVPIVWETGWVPRAGPITYTLN